MEPALSEQSVHDLEVLGIAGHCPQEPVPPTRRLLRIALFDQDIQGERRVAQPAVPVVPVSRPPDLLGERRGRCGHNATTGGVCESFEREQTPYHFSAPATLVGTTSRPLLPESRRVGKQ